MPWSPDITYKLLDYDGSFVSDIVLVRERSGVAQVAVSACGSGKLAVDPGGLDVTSLAATFVYGRYIQVLQNGVAIAAWKIEGPSPERERDVAGGFLSLAGRGWACDWAGVKTLPPGGVGQKPAPDYRLFNFASPDHPDLAAAVWEATSTVQGKVSDPASLRKSVDAAGDVVPAPIGFEDPDAYWIGPAADYTDAPVDVFYRSVFTLASETTVAIVTTADNFYTVFLNGASIIGDTDKVNSWSERRRGEITLPAGTHHLAAKVRNTGVTDPLNPVGWAYTVFTMDANGAPDTIIARSDGTDEIVAHDPAEEPGWTPGEILVLLFAEAQARGLLLDWTLSFDGDEDSAGAAWARIPSIAIGVGESMLRMLELLFDDGWIDWNADPDAKVMNAYAAGHSVASAITLRDEDTSVTDDGVDVVLADVDWGQTEPAPNIAVVRYAKGYRYVDDSAGAPYKEEVTLTVDTDIAAEADRLGALALARSANVSGAVTAQVDPVDGPSTPFSGFGLYDLVSVPSRAGVLTAVRTLSLTVKDDGVEPVYVAEWNLRRRSREVRRQELLQTLGSAIVGDAPASKPRSASNNGGYAPSSAPVFDAPALRAPALADFPTGPPPDDPTSVQALHEVVFSFPGLLDVEDDTGWWPVPFDCEIVEIEAVTRVAAALGLRVINEASVEWFDTMADNTDVQTWAESIALVAGTRLRARIQDVDDGLGEDLTIVVRYVEST